MEIHIHSYLWFSASESSCSEQNSSMWKISLIFYISCHNWNHILFLLSQYKNDRQSYLNIFEKISSICKTLTDLYSFSFFKVWTISSRCSTSFLCLMYTKLLETLFVRVPIVGSRLQPFLTMNRKDFHSMAVTKCFVYISFFILS